MIDFSGISSRSLVGRLARLLLRVVPDRLVVRILQGPARGLRWIKGSSVNGCWLGSYERDKQLKLASTLQPGMVFLDIGANVGFYSLLGARLVGGTGRVFAIEPLPGNLEHLRRHLSINRLTNVTVLDLAASDTRGTARFDDAAGPSMGKLNANGRIDVRTESIDSLVETGAIPAPNVVKIDVEGAEAAVLRGMVRTITKKRPIIFVATHGVAVHDETVDLLGSFQYTICGIGGKDPGSTDELLAESKEPVTYNSDSPTG